jgi:glycerol kinase
VTASDSLLVIDVGTSGLRAAIVRPDATVEHAHYQALLPSSPAPGFVEFDPMAMAKAALDCAHAALADGGPVGAVGITNQRASTIVWDRATGEPVGPGVGWQDLRTAGMCLMLREQGLRVAPNASATKLAFLLDMADPERDRDLCVGTVDTWIAWTLSSGALHVTDLSNAAVTALMHGDGRGWNEATLELLRVPAAMLPDVVDSSGIVGEASVLEGSPPIAGIAGDQQASLIGQGCVRPGLAKITFGTGGMLDMVVGRERPAFETTGEAGTFPIVAWRRGGTVMWGIEAIMLSAGTNVEWLRDDLGLIETSADSEQVAAQCDSADGVVYVPALLGLGTPYWDYGARGTLLGITRGTERAHVVRAVLEGVAQRGADLVEAAEADGSTELASLRIDGGMAANQVFVQALADSTGKQVEVSPQQEATTLGAGFLAGLATGTWTSEDDIAATWRPARVVEPRATFDRQRWRDACSRAQSWIPELSSLEF